VRKTLSGERRGKAYRLGDRVRILVLKASMEERKIDFRLVEEQGDEVDELPPRGQPAKRKKQKY
jgi:ribonuclease R